MSRQARTFTWLCAVLAASLAPSVTRAGLITQTATLPLTSTDFGPDNSKVAPIVFQKFDTQGGTRTLTSVDLSFHAAIMNNFGMTFTTPSTITVSVATGDTTTPGPSITLYQPDGVHTLLTVSEPNDPSVLTRSQTYGFNAGETLSREFSSSLPSTSPFYIAPTLAQASKSLSLAAPADLALFTGTGTLRLPVSAAAVSHLFLSSGNGSASVTTQGTADVTVTYNWKPTSTAPETVPEPAAVILWGIGALGLFAAREARRRHV